MKAGDRVTILIDDNTRPTPVKKILPFVFDELKLAGVRDKAILILIAGGTHRPMSDKEVRFKLGDAIQKKYRIVKHDWKDKKNLIEIGISPAGFPIEVNRLAVEADFCVGIGDISPHPLCGWSGGGKLIEPGVCGARTTGCVHAYSSQFTATSFLGIDENPIRREIDTIGKMAGLRFIINTVLDSKWKIAGVFAGDTVAAHREGVKLAKTIWTEKIETFADIVIASSHPADLDYWQAQKSLPFMVRAVRRGGDLILVTPCPEGLSSEEKHRKIFERYCLYPAKEIFRKALRNGEDDLAGVNTAVGQALTNELADITIVSHGLTKEVCNCLGVNYEKSVDDALRKCLEKNGPKAKVIVMTHGPKVIPVYEKN